MLSGTCLVVDWTAAVAAILLSIDLGLRRLAVVYVAEMKGMLMLFVLYKFQKGPRI